MATRMLRVSVADGATRWVTCQGSDRVGDVVRSALADEGMGDAEVTVWMSSEAADSWVRCSQAQLRDAVSALPDSVRYLRLLPTDSRVRERSSHRPSHSKRGVSGSNWNAPLCIFAISGWLTVAVLVMWRPAVGGSRRQRFEHVAAPPPPPPPHAQRHPASALQRNPHADVAAQFSPQPRRADAVHTLQPAQRTPRPTPRTPAPVPATPPPVQPQPTPRGRGRRPSVLLLQYVCFGPRGHPGCADSNLWRYIPEELTRGPDDVPAPFTGPGQPPCISARTTPRRPSRAVSRKLLEAGGPQEPAFYTLSAQNKAAYCLRHGYGMYIAGHDAYQDATTRARAWGVIHAIEIGIREGWDYVLYIDSDTLITEGSTAVHEIAETMPKSAHVGLTRDWNGINGGIMIWRGTREALALAGKVWKRGGMPGFNAFHPWTFQLGISTVLNEDPQARSITHVFPQRTMNSYPGWTPGLSRALEQRWHPGDWLVHFAGCSDQRGRNCENELRQFLPHVRGLGCGGLSSDQPPLPAPTPPPPTPPPVLPYRPAASGMYHQNPSRPMRGYHRTGAARNGMGLALQSDLFGAQQYRR